jgi:hypothetical protein
MSRPDRSPGEKADSAREAMDADASTQLERQLDDALRDTFPASDPISVVLPQPKSTE